MASFAQVDWSGRPIRIEYEWVGAGDAVMVFLHEGLGSLAMWRDFPARLASALGMRGLAYSRPGYGRSTPREARERWQGDYLHRQAFEVLPALLDELGIDAPAWLFGHSDGASIALLFAARSPSRTAGVIAMAPHVFVEPVALEGIERAREAYRAGALRDRLARYHDDVDSAFWGWNDVVQYLFDHGAKLDVKDSGGMSPIDAAMGKAGGNSRGGQRIDVHEDTAALLRKLGAK